MAQHTSPDTTDSPENMSSIRKGIHIPKYVAVLGVSLILFLISLSAYLFGMTQKASIQRSTPYPEVKNLQPTQVPQPTDIQEPTQKQSGIPLDIRKKYMEMKLKYPATVGYPSREGLKYCTKESHSIYAVIGGVSSDTTETHYYSEKGEFIGSFYRQDDSPYESGYTEIQLNTYECDDITLSPTPEVTISEPPRNNWGCPEGTDPILEGGQFSGCTPLIQ